MEDESSSMSPTAQGSTDDGGEGSSTGVVTAEAEKKIWRPELVPELRFPPGYHFRPTDEELVDVYLRAKIEGRAPPLDVIKEVEILNFQPEVLIGMYTQYAEQLRWYFFTKREKSTSNKKKLEPRRKLHMEGKDQAPSWKATGSVVPILRGGEKIGTKRILIYRSSVVGEEEKWSMNEYVMADHAHQMDQWILCTIQIKLRWDAKKSNEENLMKGDGEITDKRKTTKRRKKGDISHTHEEPTNTPGALLPFEEETKEKFHDHMGQKHTSSSSVPAHGYSSAIEHHTNPGEQHALVSADGGDQVGMQMYIGNADTTSSFMGQKHTSSDSVPTNGYSSAIDHQTNPGDQQAMVSAGGVTSDQGAFFTNFYTETIVPPIIASDPADSSLCPHGFERWEFNTCRLCVEMFQ